MWLRFYPVTAACSGRLCVRVCVRVNGECLCFSCVADLHASLQNNQRLAPRLTLFPPNSLPAAVAMVSACRFVWLPWRPHITALLLLLLLLLSYFHAIICMLGRHGCLGAGEHPGGLVHDANLLLIAKVLLTFPRWLHTRYLSDLWEAATVLLAAAGLKEVDTRSFPLWGRNTPAFPHHDVMCLLGSLLRHTHTRAAPTSVFTRVCARVCVP